MDDLDLDQPIASPPLVTIHDADLASVQRTGSAKERDRRTVRDIRAAAGLI